MFAKEAYLEGGPRDALLGRGALLGRDRAIDAEFAEAAAAELTGAYRLAGYILADAAEAQDAVQDACIRAWRGWSGLRERDRFHAWFSQILVNVCRSRLRAQRRHPLEPLDGFDTADADPFRAALARDAVGRELTALSDELRLVVVLRYWGEFSLAEIAERLRIPIGTVKSRHHAALAALRRRLETAEGTIR